MKPGLAKILAMAAVTGSAMALSASSGRAGPAAFAAPAQEQQFSDADRAAFLDARIAALHAGLKLSPEQEKLWPPRRKRFAHGRPDCNGEISKIQKRTGG